MMIPQKKTLFRLLLLQSSSSSNTRTLFRVVVVVVVARVEKAKMVVQSGQSVRADDAASCGSGNAHAGRDAIPDAVEFFNAFDGRSREHFWRRNDGAVRASVSTQPFFVRRRRGEEFEDGARANVWDDGF